jgi:hypothetical protein
MIASPRLAESTQSWEESAIPHHPLPRQGVHPLPLCACMRSPRMPVTHERHNPHRATRISSRYCRPRRYPAAPTYSRAGAATPAQQSATQPQESPRTDSNTVHGTSLLRSSATDGPASAAPPRAARSPVASITAWLAGIRQRIGTRLFLATDEEAHWRGWRITERRGGLARGYRDARFEPHRQQWRAGGRRS